MKRVVPRLFYALLTVGVLSLDQAIKCWILRQPLGVSIFSISGLIEITHQINHGAAFSLLSGHTQFILLVSCVLLPLIVYVLLTQIKLTSAGKAALACLIGGSLGNLIDRLVYGGVIDYIRLLFIPFPVFNLADICITLSISALAFALLTEKQIDCQE